MLERDRRQEDGKGVGYGIDQDPLVDETGREWHHLLCIVICISLTVAVAEIKKLFNDVVVDFITDAMLPFLIK